MCPKPVWGTKHSVCFQLPFLPFEPQVLTVAFKGPWVPWESPVRNKGPKVQCYMSWVAEVGRKKFSKGERDGEVRSFEEGYIKDWHGTEGYIKGVTEGRRTRSNGKGILVLENPVWRNFKFPKEASQWSSKISIVVMPDYTMDSYKKGSRMRWQSTQSTGAQEGGFNCLRSPHGRGTPNREKRGLTKALPAQEWISAWNKESRRKISNPASTFQTKKPEPLTQLQRVYSEFWD